MVQPTRRRNLLPNSIHDTQALLKAMTCHGIKESNARLIWRWFCQQSSDLSSASEFYTRIPQLSKAAMSLALEQFTLSTSRVVGRKDSADQSTTKLLIQLQDGQRIESVIMRYNHVKLQSFPGNFKPHPGKMMGKRVTLCISSQVGCAMGCTFCATGTMGLLSNLTCGEILEQLVHARAIEPSITNIVFMGMGEPLDNYAAVLDAIRAMIDTGRWGISPAKISLSTVGVVPRIRQLIQDIPQVGLALSLHAPNQTLRTQIVPTAKAWGIHRILEACDEFIAHQNKYHNPACRGRRRVVLIEYVLIKNVNSSLDVADELGRLLQGRDVLLNVIPYNPTKVPYNYEPPSNEETRAFIECVKEYGVMTLQRQELGQDISSACGQLVLTNKTPSRDVDNHCADFSKPVQDIEDLLGKTGASARTQVPNPRSRIKQTHPPLGGGSEQTSQSTPEAVSSCRVLDTREWVLVSIAVFIILLIIRQWTSVYC